MNKFLYNILQKIIPKTEIQLLLEDIDKLKIDPNNYGKVAMMYLKLQNIYGMLLGRTHDDKLNFLMVDFYGKQYKLYRELFIEYKLKNK